ncbi:MAG: hypothetical protein AAGA48_04600 [Myxococcota bacterium]
MRQGWWNLPRFVVVDVLQSWPRDREAAPEVFSWLGWAAWIALCVLVGLGVDVAVEAGLGVQRPRLVPSAAVVLFAGVVAVRLRRLLRSADEVQSALRGSLHVVALAALVLVVLHVGAVELHAAMRPTEVQGVASLLVDGWAKGLIEGYEGSIPLPTLRTPVAQAAVGGLQLAWAVTLVVAWLASSRFVLAFFEVLIPGLLGGVALEATMLLGSVGGQIAGWFVSWVVPSSWFGLVDAVEIGAELLVIWVQVSWVAAVGWLLASDIVPRALLQDRWPFLDTVRGLWAWFFTR